MVIKIAGGNFTVDGRIDKSLQLKIQTVRKKTFSGKKLEEASGRVTEKKSLTDLQDEKTIEGLIIYEETDQELPKDR